MSETNIEDELTAYVDGELNELDAARVKAALAADPKLASLERQLRSTVAAVEALPSPEPSQALRRAVLNGLDAQPKPFSLARWLMPAFGLAAAAAVVLVLTQPGTGTEVEEEQFYVASNFEVLEDLDLAGLESAEDLEVIAQLNQLEATP